MTIRLLNFTRSWRNAVVMAIAALVLAGCQPPNIQPQVSQVAIPEPSEPVYLDVVVPVFQALPRIKATGEVDLDAIESDGIWPQLRRAEAKRFAVQTKLALESYSSFGAVNVVPRPLDHMDLDNAAIQVFGDGEVYVLGEIEKSDSSVVQLNITVVDASGNNMGKKTFTHEVHKAYYRDRTNQGKDSYAPVFRQIAKYVDDLVKRKSAMDKQQLKLVSELSFAVSMSPERYGRYLNTTKGRKNNFSKSSSRPKTSIIALPNEGSGSLRKVQAVRTHNQALVDKLQGDFVNFSEQMDKSYIIWQEETLSYAVAVKEQEQAKAMGTALAVIGTLVALNSDDRSSTGAKVATLAAAYGATTAMQANQTLVYEKKALDEMGKNIDFTLSDQVRDYNGEMFKLSGTSREQMNQWQAKLKEGYLRDTANGKIL